MERKLAPMDESDPQRTLTVCRNPGRWFIAGAAVFLSFGLRAQEMSPRDFNFFGSEVVFPQFAPFYTRTADPAKAASNYAHMLFFAGDRHLAGRLVELNDKEVVWQRPDVRELLRFPRRAVRRIVLADGPSDMESPVGAPKAKNVGSLPATVKLAGGDWLFGDVTSADGQTFTSQLADGTFLTMPRKQIQWLYFASQPGPGFGCSGSAMDMEGWVPSYVSATAAERTISFRGSSWIGRWIDPPKRFELAFELPEDGEEGTRLWLQNYSARPSPTSPDNIQVTLGKKEISRMISTNRIDRERIQLPREAQDEKGAVRYQLFYDGTSERLIVVRNGRQVADWSFVREQRGKRRLERYISGLCFDNALRRDSAPLKINRLVMSPWDGVMENPAAADEPSDRFSAGDGVSISGKLEKVGAKELLFSGKPQARSEGAFVRFRNAPDSLAGAMGKVILGGNQGEFNVQRLDIHQGKVRCATSFSSAVDLPVSAVKMIMFPEPTAKSSQPEQVLIFKNCDELAGHAISAVSKGALHWQTTPGQDLEIQPERIAGIRLTTRSETPPAQEVAAVELRDGQSWRGRITGYDGRQLTLDHAQIGPVVLESGLLWHLYPNPKVNAVDGGCEPAAWMQEPAYHYRNPNNERDTNPDPWLAFAGSYIHRQAGRQVVFAENDAAGLQHRIDPALERFEVRFDTISPATGGTHLFVTLLGEKPAPSLTISASHTDLYLSVSDPTGAHRSESHNFSLVGKVPEMTSRLSFRLFVDLKTGSGDVFVNGLHVIHLGDMAAERFTKGEYALQLRTVPTGWVPDVFSNLWIGPWNGDLPSPDKVGAASTGLTNGDVLPAAPKEMRDGKWIVESDLGLLELPAEKIVAVDFGGAPNVQVVVARVRLLDGSTLNLDEFAWKDREFTARSALLGNIRLLIEKIAELVYDPALPSVPVAVKK